MLEIEDTLTAFKGLEVEELKTKPNDSRSNRNPLVFPSILSSRRRHFRRSIWGSTLRMASEYDNCDKPRPTDGANRVREAKAQMLMFGRMRVDPNWEGFAWAQPVLKHRGQGRQPSSMESEVDI